MQTLVAELVEVLGACPERIGSSTALPPASWASLPSGWSWVLSFYNEPVISKLFFSIFIYLAASDLSCSRRDLVSWPGIETEPTELGAVGVLATGPPGKSLNCYFWVLWATLASVESGQGTKIPHAFKQLNSDGCHTERSCKPQLRPNAAKYFFLGSMHSEVVVYSIKYSIYVNQFKIVDSVVQIFYVFNILSSCSINFWKWSVKISNYKIAHFSFFLFISASFYFVILEVVMLST